MYFCDIFIFFMAEHLHLPKNIVLLKKRIIENNGYSTHELNDEILSDIKKDFENLKVNEMQEGRTHCLVSLNVTEIKFMENIKQMFGITFTQLYTNAIIKIAKKEKLI